jgi:hypothetical protein
MALSGVAVLPVANGGKITHIAHHGVIPAVFLWAGTPPAHGSPPLLCTDASHIYAEGVSLRNPAGCLPDDGDTYEVPAMIYPKPEDALTSFTGPHAAPAKSSDSRKLPQVFHREPCPTGQEHP